MQVLFDVAHPAHVHFYRHMRRELLRRGHGTVVVARQKDVTHELLEAYGIPFVTVGASRKRSLAGQAMELLERDVTLWRLIRQHEIDVVCTRNPAGTHAAFFSRIPSIFDTDDGTAVGIHYRTAAPFATTITSPRALGEGLGRKHRAYDAYKALAYLHPNHFTPDPGIKEELGVGDDLLFVVRLVALNASHDRHESGLDRETRRALVRRLAAIGRVVISSEDRDLDEELRPYRMHVPPHRMHDVLAAADLCVGDSQTVAIEAGILGTPALRLSSFSGRIGTLREPEERYGLLWNFRPGEVDKLWQRLELCLEDLPSVQAQVASGRRRLIEDSIDLVAWYADLVEETVRQR